MVAKATCNAAENGYNKETAKGSDGPTPYGSKENKEKEAFMLTFKPAAQRDVARLRRYYKNCDYQLCEYSALVKLMWR